jgi:hypothetical protein
MPLGMYWRSRALVFSFRSRRHGLCGSQKMDHGQASPFLRRTALALDVAPAALTKAKASRLLRLVGNATLKWPL